MEISKRRKSTVIIYSIVAFVFILLTLTIPFSKPVASWVMFAFSIVSIIGGCGISIYAFSKSEELKSKFYGFPVFRIGFLYTTIQLGLSLLVYIVGAFVDLPYWVGLLLSVLLIGMAAIGVLIIDNARDYVEEIETNTITVAKTIKKFNVDIAEVLDICKNQEVHEPLKKLAEKFKYSDRVSSNAAKEKEEEIKVEIENLKLIINNENPEIVIKKIETISNLLSSRNRICEAEK